MAAAAQKRGPTMTDTDRKVGTKAVPVNEPLEQPYQIATHFAITSDDDGFYLFFGNADPFSIDPSTNEIKVHPLHKVFVGKNMMQRVIRSLLTNQEIQELPELKEARIQAEKEISDFISQSKEG